eukprot:23613-Prymnesium_polylepis.1
MAQTAQKMEAATARIEVATELTAAVQANQASLEAAKPKAELETEAAPSAQGSLLLAGALQPSYTPLATRPTRHSPLTLLSPTHDSSPKPLPPLTLAQAIAATHPRHSLSPLAPIRAAHTASCSRRA